MFVIRETGDRQQQAQSARFDAPLPKELRIVIGANALEPTGKAIYKLKDWRYRILDAKRADLELIVEEIRQSRFAKWFASLPSDTQHFVAGFPVILLLLLMLLAVLSYYSHPDYTPLWTFAGRHIRALGSWGLLIFLSFIVPWQLRLYGGVPSFAKMFFSLLFMMTGIVLAAAWYRIAALPEHFTGSEREYAAYAQALASKLSASYWPILVAGLPWLSVAFKALGLDLAEKATEALAKSAKPD